jgi:SPP1 family holin
MKVKADTIARTIFLALTLINLILNALGKVPLQLEESQIYEICTLAAVIVASLSAWWKNNSFTQAAMIADKVLAREKLRESVNSKG